MNEALCKTKKKKSVSSGSSQKNYISQFKQFNVLLHPVRDKDLISWLEQQPNKQKAMRDLIRKEITD